MLIPCGTCLQAVVGLLWFAAFREYNQWSIRPEPKGQFPYFLIFAAALMTYMVR